MTGNLPRASGIYQIRCIPTGKIYIGSATDLRTRWNVHKRDARLGIHHNQHFQNAWNAYGEGSFKCTVLELVNTTQLLDSEQKWLDETRCYERAVGFNISRIAGSPGDLFARTWEGFIDPDGNEVTIHNLYEFCREHGLSASAMVALSRPQHKLRQHKGWTHRDSPRKRDYIKIWEGFIDPDGNQVPPITNLKEFCRQNGLDATHMIALLKGRICSHKGWTHRDGRARQDKRTYYGFINPQGKRVTITNLTAFCAAHDLSVVHMFNLISGLRKQHKGWIWRPQDEPEASG